jgi:predicted dehydrogenase
MDKLKVGVVGCGDVANKGYLPGIVSLPMWSW